MTVISGAVIRLLGRLPTRTHACSRVVRVLVVGLGVDRIVDARVYRITHPPCVWGCCCLCWPISTSQLIGPLPVFHFWPINPVVCWGPTRTPKVFCGDLILKMVSRLDAFSGYPSRT